MQNEEKRKRIIAAFTVSGVILIVILFAVVIYQIVEISVLSERRSKLRQEYEQILDRIEEGSDRHRFQFRSPYDVGGRKNFI